MLILIELLVIFDIPGVNNCIFVSSDVPGKLQKHFIMAFYQWLDGLNQIFQKVLDLLRAIKHILSRNFILIRSKSLY